MVLLKGKHGFIALVVGIFLANLLFSEQNLSIGRQMQVNEKQKPFRALNILTLGGSITWGAQVTDPYPTLLQFEGHNVTNLAVRGHGSDYPARCIYSMLHDYRDGSKQFDPDESFDVVILEFSVNGMIHFDLLLRRLKDRYPDALFIYVDLNSLINLPALRDSELTKIVDSVDGNFFSFPKPKSLDNPNEMKFFERLYANDKHHLNDRGHSIVTSNVLQIISKANIPDRHTLGSWHGGDTCNSIFQTGRTLFDFSGDATLQEFDTNKHQFAIDVGSGGAVLTYSYNGEQDADLLLGYMTKCVDGHDPRSSLYPPVVIKISQTKEGIQTAVKEFESGDVRVTPSENNRAKYVVDVDGWTYLDSLYKRIIRRIHHQSQTSVIGVVKPGINFIYVRLMKETENPFRITSTVVCEACWRLNQESTQIM